MTLSMQYLAHWLRGRNLHIFRLLILGLLCAPFVSAQSGAGAIQGTVTDSTGAVIVGAKVHVENNATSVASDATANGVGFYEVSGLFAGQYTVTISAPGMKPYQTGIELLVSQRAVINATLSPGSVSTNIQVTADTAQLTTTDSGAVTSDLESSRINQLPMNIREVLTLVGETTPGLVVGKGTGGYIVNGLESESMEFVADGVSLSNRQFGGVNQAQGQIPDPDAVQEVRVQMYDSGAQFATPGTAILTTKSGTNSLHGTTFWTARNNAIGIAKNRNNPSNYAAPHLVRNEVGASAGGPIIVPWVYHGKDKSFWFFAYERYSLANPASESASVPSDAMRGGNFSGYTNGSNVNQQLYDPLTTHSDTNCNGSGAANQYCRAPFGNGILGDPGNNQIPAGRLAPTTKILYDITPHATNGNNPMSGSNITFPNPNYTAIPTITFRLDHSFSENNRAYLRYTSINQVNDNLRNNPNSPVSVAADGFPAAATGLALNPTVTYAGAIGFDHTFSPTFFSETIVGQQWFAQHNLAGGSPTTDFEQMLGLPNNFGEAGFPQISSGLLNGNGGWGGTQYIYGLSQIVSTIDENLTKTLGRHQLQFGGRYRHERFGIIPDESSDSPSFNGQGTGLYNTASGTQYTGVPNTGGGDADLFLGNAASYGVTESPAYEHARDMEFDAYVQDDFHVNRNLTVNLGLRWEDHPAPEVAQGVFNSFDYKNDAMVLGTSISNLISEGYTTQAIITNMENNGAVYETAQQAGFPAALMKGYPDIFDPRVGFAYQPFGSEIGTVIRGGYGRYSYPTPVRNFLRLQMANNPLKASYSQSFTNPAQTPDGIVNAQLRFQQGGGAWTPTSQFLPIMGTNSANAVNSSTLNAILPGVGVTTTSLSMPPDIATQVNATIEQPLKGNSALRVTWIWSHGSNLDHYFSINNGPSSFVWGMYTDSALTGAFAANGNEATRPFDTKTWGGNNLIEKNGWSNDYSLQANYERLFHKGFAYQISYSISNAFRFGGNWSRDGTVTPAVNFLGVNPIYSGTTFNTVFAPTSTTQTLGGIVTPVVAPPPVPAGLPSWRDYHALDRYESYYRDTNVPQHLISANWLVDLPVGRGKHFLGNANRWEDEIVGGWQIAGDAVFKTQFFALGGGSNWGQQNPIVPYKNSVTVVDCTGTCQNEKLWFNGYVAPTASAMGKISGLPSGYQVNSPTSPAFSSPINFTQTKVNGVWTITGTNNNVNIVGPLATISAVGYSPGTSNNSVNIGNPWTRGFMQGPKNYNADLSVYKVFPITERVFLRFNADAFNVFNIQGYNNPNTTTGEIQIAPGGVGASSFWTPRQIQLTARLTF